MGIVNFMILLLANYTIWGINHASGLRLNKKKTNYLANQVKICNCATKICNCATRV
jgi:hypothetical protein